MQFVIFDMLCMYNFNWSIHIFVCRWIQNCQIVKQLSLPSKWIVTLKACSVLKDRVLVEVHRWQQHISVHPVNDQYVAVGFVQANTLWYEPSVKVILDWCKFYKGMRNTWYLYPGLSALRSCIWPLFAEWAKNMKYSHSKQHGRIWEMSMSYSVVIEHRTII